MQIVQIRFVFILKGIYEQRDMGGAIEGKI
jgi:hypothetical protein